MKLWLSTLSPARMNIKVKISESSHGDDTDKDSVVSSDDDFEPANVCSSSESGSDESG